MEQAKILVLDDEQAIGDMVDIILRKEGFFEIDVCITYREAEAFILKRSYDLYILDIMLPDGTGLELAEQIRKQSDAPIFFLTAKTSDADKLRGFMHGADDYITKPFNPMELAARVKVQTSRYLSAVNKRRTLYDFGQFQLDVDAAELIVNGVTTQILGKQFHLLKLFCEHPNQVLSKEQLYQSVWGMDSFIDDNTIMVHIRRLREKIEINPSRPFYLKTVRGIGYKLQTEGE
ncbi:DNA-binding response regulator [Sporosarcina sp. P20a]|uniref:response regulator transcription factor n=1 Tax=Sporosarcina sp. P20a TaxID=2048256 RepID=UPI000C16E24B|nr:response regulator transcription factor [Sporosarcina sp. P20a]PIC85282.1 DNA-binding response regulator [Sporosarcina sp. P20a]